MYVKLESLHLYVKLYMCVKPYSVYVSKAGDLPLYVKLNMCEALKKTCMYMCVKPFSVYVCEAGVPALVCKVVYVCKVVQCTCM